MTAGILSRLRFTPIALAVFRFVGSRVWSKLDNVIEQSAETGECSGGNCEHRAELAVGDRLTNVWQHI